MVGRWDVSVLANLQDAIQLAEQLWIEQDGPAKTGRTFAQ